MFFFWYAKFCLFMPIVRKTFVCVGKKNASIIIHNALWYGAGIHIEFKACFLLEFACILKCRLNIVPFKRCYSELFNILNYSGNSKNSNGCGFIRKETNWVNNSHVNSSPLSFSLEENESISCMKEIVHLWSFVERFT